MTFVLFCSLWGIPQIGATAVKVNPLEYSILYAEYLKSAPRQKKISQSEYAILYGECRPKE